MARGKVILEWQYDPPDYFETEFEEERVGYSLTIGKGKAVAIFDSDFFDDCTNCRQELHDEIIMRLESVQLLNHRRFSLSNSTKVRILTDGRTEQFLEAKVVISSTLVFGGDIQLHDKHGNLVYDSRQERIKKQKELTNLIMRHRGDVTLEKLLGSFEQALNSPEIEFFHLYEIRDALETKFGKGHRFRTPLGIEDTQDSRFVALCNHKSLRQGRHRGMAKGKLRDATDAELLEARNIAQAMIEAYVRYLEEMTTHP